MTPFCYQFRGYGAEICDESVVAALGRWDSPHSTTFLFLDGCKACAGQAAGLA